MYTGHVRSMGVPPTSGTFSLVVVSFENSQERNILFSFIRGREDYENYKISLTRKRNKLFSLRLKARSENLVNYEFQT